MQDQLFPVPFYEDTVVLVGHDNEPFVAMKPIVTNMGLSWQGQHEKLVEKFGSTIREILTVGDDGKQRGMICLPLRKLPAWLYSISPNKVAPELRDKIVRYQSECDDALWDYWTKGSATRPGKGATISQQLSAHNARLKLLDKLELERHPEKRLAIHQQLDHVSRILGLPTPALEAIGYAVALEPIPSMVVDFWEMVEFIGMDKLNHSRDSQLIAINLNHFVRLAAEQRLKAASTLDLRRVLARSLDPKFLEQNKTVNSRIEQRAVKCWVFASGLS